MVAGQVYCATQAQLIELHHQAELFVEALFNNTFYQTEAFTTHSWLFVLTGSSKHMFGMHP